MGLLPASSATAFSTAYFCENLNAVRIPSEEQVTNTYSIHTVSLQSHRALLLDPGHPLNPISNKHIYVKKQCFTSMVLSRWLPSSDEIIVKLGSLQQQQPKHLCLCRGEKDNSSLSSAVTRNGQLLSHSAPELLSQQPLSCHRELLEAFSGSQVS